MGQKNIPVDSYTYEILKSLKRPSESFRELILRLIRSQGDRVLRHFGAWELDEDELVEIRESLTQGWTRWGE
jgi:predicted CopG family antitoxin